jgi:phosphatidylglycerophosphate synthase
LLFRRQWLPNLLTLGRLALGLAFPMLPARWRLVALLVATATEFLDGQIARLLHAPSAVGRALDPIADKVFVTSVLATLLWESVVAAWQLILVASRDIIVMAGALGVVARCGRSALRRITPSLLGKLATAAQFLFLLSVVATHAVGSIPLILASAFSLAAGIAYAMRFRWVHFTLGG